MNSFHRMIYKNQRKTQGFTLVELAIVLVMIGLTSMATMRLISVYNKHKKTNTDVELMKTNAHGVFRNMTQQSSLSFTDPHLSADYPFPYLRQIDGPSSTTIQNPDLKDKDGRAYTYLPAYELTKAAFDRTNIDICKFTKKTGLSIKYCLDSTCTKFKTIDDIGLIIAPNGQEFTEHVKYSGVTNLTRSLYESSNGVVYTVTKTGLSDSSLGSDSIFIEPKELVYFTLADLHERFNCLATSERGTTAAYTESARYKENYTDERERTYIDLKIFGDGDYCVEADNSLVGHYITDEKPTSSGITRTINILVSPGRCTNPNFPDFNDIWHTSGPGEVLALYARGTYTPASDPYYFKVPAIQLTIYSKRTGDKNFEQIAATIPSGNFNDYSAWLPVKKKTILIPLEIQPF